jgi:hypothetical protein
MESLERSNTGAVEIVRLSNVFCLISSFCFNKPDDVNVILNVEGKWSGLLVPMSECKHGVRQLRNLIYNKPTVVPKLWRNF